jgi:hypothetical protein
MDDSEKDELGQFQRVKAPADNLIILAGAALLLAITVPIVWSI